MVIIGSNELDCPVPLAFGKRFLILHKGGNDPVFSVVLDYNSEPQFEIMENEPVENPITEVSKTPVGIITVSDKKSERFLYKIRPGSETSVVFGTINSGEIEIKITDSYIKINGCAFKNNKVRGQAGIVVDENGGIGMGCPMPASLIKLFKVQ